MMNKELILEEELTKQMSFNRPQMHFIMLLWVLKSATSIWGRGTGKSSIIAYLIKKIVESMPRAMWVIQGVTFQQLMTRTLPGTFAFLDKIGYKRDRDYFINKFPPKGYDLPFECPLTPENCIFFLNHKYKCAVGFSLFSQDRSSSRGPNRDGVICDESLLLDWDKFTAETLATVRGNDAYFRKVSIHKGVFHFSSMPSGENKLFESGDYYSKLGYDLRGISDKRIELQYEFMTLKSKKERLEIWKEIDELSYQLKFQVNPKNKLLYTEWNTFDNIENLGIKYLQQQFDSMPKFLFMIEILNKRQTQIMDSFYPSLHRRTHGYRGQFNYEYLDSIDFLGGNVPSLDSRQDLDCIKSLPLHLGIDFGVHINWFVTAQHDRALHRLNFIKNHYVKSPKIIDDLALDWCDYYKHHPTKLVFLYPGSDGLKRQPNVKGQQSYVNQITDILRKKGWRVVENKVVTYEYAHHDKYLCWSRALTQVDKRYPSIGINLSNCYELMYAMEQTPAIDKAGKIGKDKDSEKKLKHNREQATDVTDAGDQVLFSMFGTLNYSRGAGFVKAEGTI